MKPALVFIALVAVAVGVWYLRGNSDSSLLNAKDAQIAAMTETLQTKEKLRVQDETLLDTRDTSIKTLQDKIKSDEDLLAKNQAQLEVDKAEYQRLQTADQTIITSLKSDNNADIQVLKEQIQAKDDQIAQLNEKLVQTIANYENQLNAPRTAPGSQPASVAEDGKKIYPADDGFDLQSLGSGMFAYQVFSQLHNPNNAPQPPSIANRTPWTFGGTGNSGITANEAFYASNAKNGNHDGTTSQAGQTAFLQFKGSWFSQKIKLPAGTYSVSFDYEARRDYGDADGIAVSLNGTDLFIGAPTDTGNFAHVTTQTITLPAAKEYELKFRGLGALNDPDGDHTTFIDNVSINIVDPHQRSPKPSPVKTVYQSGNLNGAGLPIPTQ